MPRNVRGQLPRELRHAKKCLDSDDEDFANKAQINGDEAAPEAPIATQTDE